MEKISKKLEIQSEHKLYFVDCKKVYDSVDHKDLFQKLYHIGSRGISQNLLEHFLTDRYQFVKIED